MNPGDADPSPDGQPDRRAGVRPAGALDRAARARERAETLGLHRRRPRLGHHHAPHRDDPPARRRAALPPGRARLLDDLKERTRRRSTSSCPTSARVGEVQRVLQPLLARGRLDPRPRHDRSRRSATTARLTKDPALLAEYCRQALARQLTQCARRPARHAVGRHARPAARDRSSATPSSRPPTAPTSASTRAAPSSSSAPSATRSSAPPRIGHRARRRLLPKVRRHLRALIAHAVPRLLVLSYNEILPSTPSTTVGAVALAVEGSVA